MSVNKVDVNGVTVLDLTQDSVTPATLKKGETAHDASGAQIIGTLEVPATEERMVELSMTSGNQVILPTSGKVMSKVTVRKPATLLPENIKKGVVIGGVTGSLEAGDTSETWIIKSSATGEFTTTQIAFTSNGQKFTSIGTNNDSGTFVILHYDNNEVAGYDPGFGGVYEFDNEAYRKLTFDTPPTGALLTWLQSNATKQTSGVSLQSKSVTYTSNGTSTITPDDGYDGLSSVDVTVNVSGGGGVETFTLKVEADGIPMWKYYVFATGIDGVFEITDFGTYDVVKNSMLFLYGTVMSKQNLTDIFSDPPVRVYEVIGNAKISLS